MSDIVAWIPPAGVRVDADPVDLRQQLFQEGLRVLWERYSRCACQLGLTPDSGDSDYRIAAKDGDPICTLCEGRGFYYYDSQEILAIVSDASGDPKWLEVYGDVMNGACKFTMLPEFIPNERDRLTVLDKPRRFTEVRQRGKGPTGLPCGNPQPLTYPIIDLVVTTGDPSDPSIPVQTIQNILSAQHSDAYGIVTTGPMTVGTDIANQGGNALFIDGGSAASGLVGLAFENVSTGFEVPAGTIIVRDDNGQAYTTLYPAFALPIEGLWFALVSVVAQDVGVAGNIPAGTYSVTSPNLGEPIESMRLDTPITNGSRSGGGNIPAVGEWFSIDYLCHQRYIIRKLPFSARQAYVSAAPYVNATSGFKGYFDASAGTLPSGTGLLTGDYFEVSTAGTVYGVAFGLGDFLVVATDDPINTQVSPYWVRIGWNEEPPRRLERLESLALAWLEDMGNPFDREDAP